MTEQEGMELFLPFAKLGIGEEEVIAAGRCILRERGKGYKITPMDIAAWLKEYCEWRQTRSKVYEEVGAKVNAIVDSLAQAPNFCADGTKFIKVIDKINLTGFSMGADGKIGPMGTIEKFHYEIIKDDENKKGGI